MEAPHMNRSVALVGSFRRFFTEIQNHRDVFESAGWRVTSPAKAEVLEEDIEFVRLSTDDRDEDDATVQSRAMARILGADLVFVIAPDGYVGKTTSYEIGRIVQARRPIFFSSLPNDLPIEVHPTRVIDASGLIRLSAAETRVWLHEDTPGKTATLERGIFLESS
jgi:hypothetical protein